MRKLALYGVVLAIIIGGVPYFTGQLVEVRFKDVANTFNDIESLPVTVAVTEYKRGWRRSSAKTRVTLFDKHPSKIQPIHFTLEHDIRHGPFVQVRDNDYKDWQFARALITAQLFLTEQAKEVLMTQVGGTDLLDLKSEIKMNGAVSIQVTGKTLKLKEHEGTSRVAWQGVQGEWELSQDGKRLIGQMLLPGFDFDWEDVHYLANNLSYKTALAKNTQGFWPGKYMMSGQQIKIENALTKASLEVDNLTSAGMMEAKDNMGDFSGSLHLEKLMINGQTYGPINFSQTIKNINLTAINALWVLLQKETPQSSDQALALSMMAVIPQLLQGRPEWMIEQLQVQTPFGLIVGSMNLAAGGAAATDLTKFNLLLRSIELRGNLSVPKVVFRDLLSAYLMSATPAAQGADTNQQVNNLISKWVLEGILIDKDQQYLIDWSLLQGKWMVNDKQKELPFSGS